MGGAIISSGSTHSGRVGTRAYRSPEVTLGASRVSFAVALRVSLWSEKGLPWGFGVDVFAVGIVIAEIYLGKQLFPSDLGCDREHLAALDRVLGPFPRAYAHTIDTRFPGTFNLNDGVVKVHYPSPGTKVTRESYGVPMRRLECMRPLSVRSCLVCESGCSGVLMFECIRPKYMTLS